jgi:hypothetical protein
VVFKFFNFMQWGHMILPVASDVKISWNAATAGIAEEVMRGSRFNKQLANLKEFLRIRDEVATSTGNRATGKKLGGGEEED